MRTIGGTAAGAAGDAACGKACGRASCAFGDWAWNPGGWFAPCTPAVPGIGRAFSLISRRRCSMVSRFRPSASTPGRAAGEANRVGGAGILTPVDVRFCVVRDSGVPATAGRSASGAKPWRRRTWSTGGVGTGGAGTTIFCDACASICWIEAELRNCADAGATGWRLTITVCGTTVTARGKWRLR